MSLDLISVVAPPALTQVMQFFCRKTAGAMLCSSQGADFPFPFPGAVLCGKEPFLPAGLLAAASPLLIPQTWSCCASAQQMVKHPSAQTFWWAVWGTPPRLELCEVRVSPDSLCGWMWSSPMRPGHPAPWHTWLVGNYRLCWSCGIFGVTVSSPVPSRIFFLDQGAFTIMIFHKYS